MRKKSQIWNLQLAFENGIGKEYPNQWPDARLARKERPSLTHAI
jgi:hypothetical protein